mgnify:CR=1 FL=1
MKITLHNVWNRRCDLSPIGAIPPFTFRNDNELLFHHDSPYYLLRNDGTNPVKHHVYASVSVDSAILLEDAVHIRTNLLITIWKLRLRAIFSASSSCMPT